MLVSLLTSILNTTMLQNMFLTKAYLGSHSRTVHGLKQIVGDIDLAYVAAFVKLTDMDAIAFSFAIFPCGAIQFTDYFGMPIGGERNPS